VSTYPLSRGDSIANALLNPVGGDHQGLTQVVARSQHEALVSSDELDEPGLPDEGDSSLSIFERGHENSQVGDR
jgi:hypothetical protein